MSAVGVWRILNRKGHNLRISQLFQAVFAIWVREILLGVESSPALNPKPVGGVTGCQHCLQ